MESRNLKIEASSWSLYEDNKQFQDTSWQNTIEFTHSCVGLPRIGEEFFFLDAFEVKAKNISCGARFVIGSRVEGIFLVIVWVVHSNMCLLHCSIAMWTPMYMENISGMRVYNYLVYKQTKSWKDDSLKVKLLGW